MNKIILILTFLMLWASPSAAQQAAEGTAGVPFEGKFGLGYGSVTRVGNTVGGEYDYLESGPIGVFDMEYDPLPHRFVFESTYKSAKDYFGELDYAYKDVVVFSGYMRGLHHNLNHYSFGRDEQPATSPLFTDQNPNELYHIENRLRRGFVRFKTPDFPFHLYAEERTMERSGTLQQRFLRSFTSGVEKVSQAREIDWSTDEVRVGTNTHLGPVEFDYSHTQKTFTADGAKVLAEAPYLAPHNSVPDLESSWNTLKLHSMYSGKVVLAGTYTNGEKTNRDNSVKQQFSYQGADVTIMPVTSLLFALRYRHYDLDLTNPDTSVNVTPTGSPSVAVRDSISSAREVVIGSLRYRVSDGFTVKGEFGTDTTDRTRGTLGATLPSSTDPAFWYVPLSTTKTTAKAGLSYRLTKKMTFRADYSQVSVVNPAYATDPDKSQTTRASLSWAPSLWFNTLLSGSMTTESRADLGAPLAGGSREAARDQALASVTLLVSKRSSITGTYSYFHSRVEQAITLQDASGGLSLDPGIAYDDTAHVAMLTVTTAPMDRVNIVASMNKSYSHGKYRLNGANTADIAALTDLKVVETEYAAGIEMQHTKSLGSELRYQYQKNNDLKDNTQDGRVQTVMATASLKW